MIYDVVISHDSLDDAELKRAKLKRLMVQSDKWEDLVGHIPFKNVVINRVISVKEE